MERGLQPFFCFYGGKWRIAPHYPQPRHRYVVELFAGGAGYSVRHFQKEVLLVERDPKIAALWRYLLSPLTSAQEILKLPLWDPSKHEVVADLGVCPEAGYLIGFWLNKGAAQPFLRPSTWMTSSVRPHSHWGEVIRQRIASQVEKVKHWHIIEGEWFWIPPKREPTTFFVDPPYANSDGRHYAYDDVDYAALGARCLAFKAGGHQVLACENEGATWLPFKHFRDAKASPGVQKKETMSREVLWTGED